MRYLAGRYALSDVFFVESFTDCFTEQAPMVCELLLEYKLIGLNSYELAMTLLN